MLALVIISLGLQVINGVIGKKKTNGCGDYLQNIKVTVL